MHQLDKSKLISRHAVPSDYSALMELSHRVYGGRDTFPAMFNDYLSDPTRHLCVGEYSGKVIGLLCVRVIDGGNTYAGEAERIHRDYAGSGLFQMMMQQFIRRHLSPRFPHITKLRFSMVDVFRENRGNIMIPGSTRSVLDFAWKVSLEHFNTALKRCDVIKSNLKTPYQILHAGHKHLISLFKDNQFRFTNVPSGIIVRDNQPFSLDYIDNVRLIPQDRCNTILLTQDGSTEAHLGISFGTGIEAGVAMDTFRYTIDYYGIPSLDLLKQHIMKHLCVIPELYRRSKTARNIFVNLFTLNSTFDRDDLERLSMFTTCDLGLPGFGSKVPTSEKCIVDYNLLPPEPLMKSTL